MTSMSDDPKHPSSAQPEDSLETEAPKETEAQADQKPDLIDRGLSRLDRMAKRWHQGQSTSTVLLFTILGLIVAAIVWASNSELDHVVRGQGKIVTTTHTQIVQSLEGGIIERIYAREGDIVQESSVLVELDPTQAQSQYGQALKEQRSLLIRIERLRAEKENREPVFSFEALRDDPDLIAAERAQFQERRAVLNSEIELFQTQVDQREKEMEQAQTDLERARSESDLAREEYNVIKDLVERELEARLSLIEISRDYNVTQAALKTAQTNVIKSRVAYAEAKLRLQQATINYQNEVGDQLATNLSRLAEVQQRLNGLKDRLNRTQLMAPVNGIVNKLHIQTEGGVVQPGEPIMELTPIDGVVEVQAEVMQKDIGFIEVGQQVSVSVTAYDFARFGDIDGEVAFVSPDAQRRQDGSEYFSVRIRLDRPFLENNGRRYPLTPGMVANASMVISKRTVMEYLIEPVLKLQDRAFRE